MPAFANLVLNDGETTPVAHTFSPARLEANNGRVIAVFEDRAGGVIVGYHRVRVETSPRNANKMIKVRLVVEYATLETLSNNTSSGINPAPTLAYRTQSSTEFWCHERSAKQERKNTRVLTLSLLNAADIVKVVDDLESIY